MGLQIELKEDGFAGLVWRLLITIFALYAAGALISNDYIYGQTRLVQYPEALSWTGLILVILAIRLSFQIRWENKATK